jgi:hypothetical protein
MKRTERGTAVPTDRLKSTRSTRGALRSLMKTWWIRVRFSGVMCWSIHVRRINETQHLRKIGGGCA